MREPDARYALVYPSSPQKPLPTAAAAATHPSSPSPAPPDRLLIGLLQYRFVVEDGEAALYIYELQLSPAVRRKGIGSWLMRIAELFALRLGLPVIFLTVHTTNRAAIGFYERLGFAEDASSPGKYQANALGQGRGDGLGEGANDAPSEAAVFPYMILSKRVQCDGRG